MIFVTKGIRLRFWFTGLQGKRISWAVQLTNTMKRKIERTEILLCRCHSHEHQILVYYDEEDNKLYLSIHLWTYGNFWQRLWRGIKYIFGYHSQYGHWDEFIFNENDADQLQAMADALKTIQQELSPPSPIL